jgi:hypothetical protein
MRHERKESFPISKQPRTLAEALVVIAELRRRLDPLAVLREALHLTCGQEPFLAAEVIAAAIDPALHAILAQHGITSAKGLAKYLPRCGFVKVGQVHRATLWQAA